MKQCDGLGNHGKGWVVRGERNGTIRCADGWEVFVALTGVNGIRPPTHCLDPNKKKKFQLDNSFHHFLVAESLLTPEMQLRLQSDVHLVRDPPAGHRDNSIEVPGIQKTYEFRSIKSHCGKTNFFTREIICFCKYCVLSKYDMCLTGSKWKKVNVDVDPSKNTEWHKRISIFYHLEHWMQRGNLSHHQKTPPMVAFVFKNRIHFGLSREQPFQIQNSLFAKDQLNQPVQFRCKARTWCLKIDLLVRLNGTSLNQYVYVDDTNNNSKAIIIPVFELITPESLNFNEDYARFNACYEFINYKTSESYSHPGQQTVYLYNYIILRACVTEIIRLSGLSIENL